MNVKIWILLGLITLIMPWKNVYAQTEGHHPIQIHQTYGAEEGQRFSFTLFGNESAILFDSQTGDTWFLRSGKQGTVWLSIPRIDLDQREKWLQEEANSQRKSNLGS